MIYMFSLMKSNQVANLVIDDYVIRMAESDRDGRSVTKSLKEKPIPAGLIESGKITDEIHFYEFMKELVQKWGIKHRKVRFYVPNSLVIMRPVEFSRKIKEENVKEYFMMEIGETIHLPFQQPIIDIHSPSFKQDVTPSSDISNQEKRQGILFAVPEEEVVKYTEIFADASLKPIAADVKELGVYRYFYEKDQAERGKSYLFFELNLTSINLSIFHNDQLEFLRYQPLNVDIEGWEATCKANKLLDWTYLGDESQQLGVIEDQINELERIMSFYRYSLHKGKQQVTDIIILGDYPNLAHVYQKINNQYDIATTLLDGDLFEGNDKKATTAFIPALGLSLKEDK